jgi:nitrite reductase/ring-hydroxylating ferredoxin subunit
MSPGEGMRFYPLERLINLHDGYSRQFKIDSYRLLLIQRKGEVYLIESHCPHREHPLEIASIENGVIQCALHHYQFAIGDGRLIHATEEPCRGLQTFNVIYEGAEVGLMLSDV